MDTFLETDRLLLRRFTAADVDALFDLDNDPEVMRYLNGGEPTPREVTERAIMPRFLQSYYRFPGFGRWAVIEKQSGQFLGWISFEPRDDGGPEEVSLGYRFRRAAWGKGYATEAARAVLHEGFTNLGVRRVTANTYEHNLASRRVMERLGMRFVRSYRLTPTDLADASFHVTSLEIWDGEDVEYAITREEWAEKQNESEQGR